MSHFICWIKWEGISGSVNEIETVFCKHIILSLVQKIIVAEEKGIKWDILEHADAQLFPLFQLKYFKYKKNNIKLNVTTSVAYVIKCLCVYEGCPQMLFS